MDDLKRFVVTFNSDSSAIRILVEAFQPEHYGQQFLFYLRVVPFSGG